jgi:uncharacterized protein (TIGR02265 family)
VAEEKLIYREGITNLLDSVRARLGPKVRERLRVEAGIDESALKPSYPLGAHDSAVKVLAEELYPGKPMDDATYEVGRGLMANYGRGVLGRALFSLIRLIGPMRMLKRVPQYFRQTNNYADVKIDVVGPTAYELAHNEVGAWPHFLRGSMQGSGEVIGLDGHAVELLAYDGHAGRFRVSWKA